MRFQPNKIKFKTRFYMQTNNKKRKKNRSRQMIGRVPEWVTNVHSSLWRLKLCAVSGNEQPVEGKVYKVRMVSLSPMGGLCHVVLVKEVVPQPHRAEHSTKFAFEEIDEDTVLITGIIEAKGE